MNDACVRARCWPRPQPLMDGKAHVRAPVSTVLQLTGAGAANAGHHGGLACRPDTQYRKDGSYSLSLSTNGHY